MQRDHYHFICNRTFLLEYSNRLVLCRGTVGKAAAAWSAENTITKFELNRAGKRALLVILV